MSNKPKEAAAAAPRRPFERVLKWAGAITALVSLFFALYQLAGMAADARERTRHIDEALEIGRAQQAAGDYASAWQSLEEAAKVADEGSLLARLMGRLDAPRQRIRTAQADLAMIWLRNSHIGSDERFSDLVDKVLPALEREIGAASGARKADLLAHVGWAYFLKSRDGPIDAKPDSFYRQSLDVDRANPFAHAYWGHWILWTHGELDAALAHFSAAAGAGRELPYVHRIEASALRNTRSDAAEAQFLRVVREMQKGKEPIDERVRSDVYSIYYFAVTSGKDFTHLTAALPASEQIAMIRALFFDPSFDSTRIPTRDAALAILAEAAGQRAESLAAWRALRATLQSDAYGSLRTRADAEIKRLSQ